ncbi:MAG: hypothetical protein IPF99_13430 [Deltaproteobacteria bacterium]|nr:hypothetical protein [Deltaproteobacteria bacterium]
MSALVHPRTVFVAFSLLFSACAPLDDAQDTAVQEVSGRPVCQYVKCAYPLCAEGQNLVIPQGQCCPVCRGPSPSDRCATVLCAAVACGEGEVLVRRGNDCCGRCERAPAVAECTRDEDCPQIMCIACPCPTTACQGRRCVTQTADASTCSAP